MKLNLGCGKKRIEGWINCDLHDSDMDMDIRHLPFDDNSADEIMVIHCVEHFYVHEIMKILREWRRVLKPDGIIVLELPCLDNILGHFMTGSTNKFTMQGLYGSPSSHKDGEPALHKWCWSKGKFRELLEDIGFTHITEEEPHYHVPSRDMRFVATK